MISFKIDIRCYVQSKYVYVTLFSYKICLGFTKSSFGIINDSYLLSESEQSKLCTYSST